MRLGRKLTLLVLVPFLVLLCVLGYRATRREVAIYESQVASDLKVTARALASPFLELWRIEGQARALQMLQAADTGLDEMHVQWLPADNAARPPGPGGPVVRFSAAGEGPGTVSVWLPLAGDGIAPGGLELSRPLDRETQLVRDVVREESAATILALLSATALTSFVGIVFVGRPVRALVGHVRGIGAGELSVRLAAHQGDELGELAREINAMCDQLAEARRRLTAEAEARVRAIEQLRHADRLSTVGRLAAGVAHELGTPLNVVLGRAKMISAQRLSSDAIVENATIIGAQVERMTQTIRHLLGFARRGDVKKTRANVSEIVGAVASLLTPLAEKRGVKLSCVGADRPVVIAADVAQLEQVVANIVVNGVDASSAGGAVVVTVEEEEVASPPPGTGAEGGRYLRLDVKDRGTGIAKDDLEHVFEPFFTTKEVGVGTGLGLSVAHGIVHDHGGWIAIESEVGKGSRFSVYLPMMSTVSKPPTLARTELPSQPGRA